MALIVNKEPPFTAKKEAFPYQSEAVETLSALPYAAIFHEQGLGKSKIAIDILLRWLTEKQVDTVIVVTKKSLIANWTRELSQHSYLSPRILSSDRTQNFYVLNSPARVILANYEAVGLESARLKLFQKTRRVAAILDESAKIKNPAAVLTKVFFELAEGFTRRLILTGTPIANRPYDIWAQVYFLDQGIHLGKSFRDFVSTMDLTNEMAHQEHLKGELEDALASVWGKISSFALRETKAGGRIQLPDKIFEAIHVPWEVKQRQMYLKIRDDERLAVIRDRVAVEDESPEILKRLLRLVQVASNPALIDEGYSNVPGKLPILEDLIQAISLKGEKAIVWTTFTQNADWLTERLAPYGATRVHGKLGIDQRNRNIGKFLDNQDCKVLVATPGAAKEGLTLTVANHVIFVDRGFSLDDYLQSQDRIHRVSQTKTCYVYNLLMEDSVDEWVDALLDAKRTAAQLAQGDISREAYQLRMSYSFGEILKRVLGLQSQGDINGRHDIRS